MGYEGLSRDDLDNVRALNVAWLELQTQTGLAGYRLTARRRERLATAPFLLFSLREHDDDWWAWLLNERRQQDLLADASPATDEVRALQSAAFAFLWELSRRNPYVTRLVSGAPLDWCERVASITLMHGLDCVARCATIEPRFASDSPASDRLFRHGASALREARRSAQLSALQVLLTGSDAARVQRLPAAACSMGVPTREVADEL